LGHVNNGSFDRGVFAGEEADFLVRRLVTNVFDGQNHAFLVNRKHSTNEKLIRHLCTATIQWAGGVETRIVLNVSHYLIPCWFVVGYKSFGRDEGLDVSPIFSVGSGVWLSASASCVACVGAIDPLTNTAIACCWVVTVF